MGSLIHQMIVAWLNLSSDWGYAGVFVGMALESTALPLPAEAVIPPAAYWASQGKFNFWIVVVVATLGSYAGSALSYFIARRIGRPLVEKYGRYILLSEEKLSKAENWIGAYGTGGIFVARLLPVIRHLISLPAGLFRMGFVRFSAMTLAGAFTYCLVLTWLSLKILGDQPELMKNPDALHTLIKAKSHYIIAGILATAFLYCLVAYSQKRASAASSKRARSS